WTPLMMVGREDARAITRALAAAGADRSARDPEGRTALIHAAHEARPEALQALLELGLDPNARDRNQATALIDAAAWAQADFFFGHDELSANGATPLPRRRGSERAGCPRAHRAHVGGRLAAPANPGRAAGAAGTRRVAAGPVRADGPDV